LERFHPAHAADPLLRTRRTVHRARSAARLRGSAPNSDPTRGCSSPAPAGRRGPAFVAEPHRLSSTRDSPGSAVAGYPGRTSASWTRDGILPFERGWGMTEIVPSRAALVSPTRTSPKASKSFGSNCSVQSVQPLDWEAVRILPYGRTA